MERTSVEPPERTRRSQIPELRPRKERGHEGKTLRDRVPRESHATWSATKHRGDPIEILERSNEDRLRELVPMRYGRMLRSPFTFLRGSAAVMAADLATTPTTDLRVQACGDCHLLNFGFFATPERNLVFDINDFDETLPAPWEWDLKRLAVSFVVAGRDRGLGDDHSVDAAMACVRSYRKHLRDYAHMSPLDVWYDKLDEQTLIDLAPDEEARKTRKQIAKKAHARVAEQLFPKIVTSDGGEIRLVDQPPLLFHVSSKDEAAFREGVLEYRQSLSEERRALLDRYRVVDFAIKVVGIGSVGTRCFVALGFSDEAEPLLLQFKEAGRSVLEPHAGKSRYDNQGQRVVMGQRLMQSSSDIFLGWARGRGGRDFYGRQLRDMKFSVPLEDIDATQLARYAELCGWTLARGHAKSGDAAAIAGYLGKSEAFDEAIAAFARAYADQNEQDHAALVKAFDRGRIDAVIEDET